MLLGDCYAPRVQGTCQEYVARWHYNITDGRCHPFYYGGCEGNNNNFLTDGECYSFCSKGQLHGSYFCGWTINDNRKFIVTIF